MRQLHLQLIQFIGVFAHYALAERGVHLDIKNDVCFGFESERLHEAVEPGLTTLWQHRRG